MYRYSPKYGIESLFIDDVSFHLHHFAGDVIAAIISLAGSEANDFAIDFLFLEIDNFISHLCHVDVRFLFVFSESLFGVASRNDDA